MEKKYCIDDKHGEKRALTGTERRKSKKLKKHLKSQEEQEEVSNHVDAKKNKI